jgi:hypothetical protein
LNIERAAERPSASALRARLSVLTGGSRPRSSLSTGGLQ